MNINSVIVTGTVTRVGDIQREDAKNNSLIFYLETTNKVTDVIENGVVKDAYLNPNRVKYVFDKGHVPKIHVGSYILVEGSLYSYKVSYNGNIMYSTGIMARRCGMAIPLSREDRGKIIQEYKKAPVGTKENLDD